MLHYLGLFFADMTFRALKHCNCISNFNRNYTTRQGSVVIMSLGHYVIKDSGLSFSPLIKLYFKYNILELFDRVLFS